MTVTQTTVKKLTPLEILTVRIACGSIMTGVVQSSDDMTECAQATQRILAAVVLQVVTDAFPPETHQELLALLFRNISYGVLTLEDGDPQ